MWLFFELHLSPGIVSDIRPWVVEYVQYSWCVELKHSGCREFSQPPIYVAVAWRLPSSRLRHGPVLRNSTSNLTRFSRKPEHSKITKGHQRKSPLAPSDTMSSGRALILQATVLIDEQVRRSRGEQYRKPQNPAKFRPSSPPLGKGPRKSLNNGVR